MKAKFTGKISMGFRTNMIYDIHAKIIENHIYIYDNNSDSWCLYRDLESVLANWKFL